MKIKVPEFGDESAYGTIISWVVEEGSEVSEGQELLEIETDKAILSINSPVKGIIREIFKGEGAIVQSGEDLAEIEKKE